VGRMVARGYDRDFAQRCFDQIKGFGEYGFPESHAASFAHLVYVSSWLRWRYPAAFACALLNSQPMGFYAPAQIVRDAREHGVEVREVDVNLSDWHCDWASGRSMGCSAKRRTGSSSVGHTEPSRSCAAGDAFRFMRSSASPPPTRSGRWGSIVGRRCGTRAR
jgi:DNA polymerase III alpha subunit